MYPTITMHQQRKPHALDLLVDGDLFYWGVDTKEAWVVNDQRDHREVLIKRRVAPEGTNNLLDYTGDDYEVWIDGGSVNIVGLLVWGTSTEHNDQSGEPGGDEVISNDDGDTGIDQCGRPVLVDEKGASWVCDKERGVVIATRVFPPYARTLKAIPSSRLRNLQFFYLTLDGSGWQVSGTKVFPCGFPACAVDRNQLPTTVYVNA